MFAVSTIMRALFFVAVFASPIARAEPPISNLRVSIQPTIATVSGTMTRSPAVNIIDSTTMTGSGVGARFDVAVGWSLGSSVELGGALRLGYHRFDALFTRTESMSRRDVTLRPVEIGPQITIRHARYYVRADMMFGTIPDADISGAGTMAMFAVGGEVGYRLPLGARIDAQLGVGGSVGWARAREIGDHADYNARTQMIALAATFSVARSF